MSAVPCLSCQHHLFDMPDTISYLDAATWSLLPRTVRDAGETGLFTKA